MRVRSRVVAIALTTSRHQVYFSEKNAVEVTFRYLRGNFHSTVSIDTFSHTEINADFVLTIYTFHLTDVPLAIQ